MNWIPEGREVPDYRRPLAALVLTGQMFAGAFVGIAAQALVAWELLFHIMPAVGLDLLWLCEKLADFNLPSQLYISGALSSCYGWAAPSVLAKERCWPLTILRLARDRSVLLAIPPGGAVLDAWVRAGGLPRYVYRQVAATLRMDARVAHSEHESMRDSGVGRRRGG